MKCHENKSKVTHRVVIYLRFSVIYKLGAAHKPLYHPYTQVLLLVLHAVLTILLLCNCVIPVKSFSYSLGPQRVPQRS